MNLLIRLLNYSKRIFNRYNSKKRSANNQAESLDDRVINFIKIIDDGHGNKRSFESKKSVDFSGNPIPWFTYPSIEYLKQLDLQSLKILEWGLGNSTLFFANRCKSIFSIEHNKQWYDLIKNQLPENANALLVDESEYVESVIKLREDFDVIIVDGIKRFDCLKASPKLVREGGIIIFDNSDRNPEYCEYMRNQNLIQVDFHGFGPIVNFTTTTSVFYTRTFNIKPLSKQPVIPIGGGY